jgi:hypothetical protein
MLAHAALTVVNATEVTEMVEEMSAARITLRAGNMSEWVKGQLGRWALASPPSGGARFLPAISSAVHCSTPLERARVRKRDKRVSALSRPRCRARGVACGRCDVNFMCRECVLRQLRYVVVVVSLSLLLSISPLCRFEKSFLFPSRKSTHPSKMG